MNIVVTGDVIIVTGMSSEVPGIGLMVTGTNLPIKGAVSIGTGTTVWSRGDNLSVSGM